jgi:hypothetical protein
MPSSQVVRRPLPANDPRQRQPATCGARPAPEGPDARGLIRAIDRYRKRPARARARSNIGPRIEDLKFPWPRESTGV